MGFLHFIALLGPLLALAGLLRLPPSSLPCAAGLATTFLPGLPPLQVDPQLLPTLVLPPILYAVTARVTWHLLRHAPLPGLLAGAAVALATILAERQQPGRRPPRLDRQRGAARDRHEG